jgi:CRISPR/Cas system CSM-associated protein Csm3 (group 7 of RAMP superfamily)
VNGKLVLTGKLKLLSPLLIGSGNNDSTDIDVILDGGGKPFITFTSFIGALKHHLKNNYDGVTDDDINNLFGFAENDNAKGSSIRGTDFFLSNSPEKILATRDGIKINLSTGIVKDKAKYDYQVVEKGSEFDFNLEASYPVLTQDNDSTIELVSKNTILTYFATIVELLKIKDESSETGLRIGAKTNNGLGKVILRDEKLFDYDFSKPAHIIKWLKREEPEPLSLPTESFIRKHDDLIIDAYLNLKTSLIQRSYNDEPSMPDASHIQSNGEDILAGSGTKGAVIARAKRIVNTIWKEDDKNKKVFLDSLLGDVDETGETKRAIKGKLMIEERKLPAYTAELHARIKIDRFTGGTINSALFDSMPLFNTKEIRELPETDLKEKYTRLTIRIKDCTEAEAGLMLLVLKDLWTGDLAIGGEKGIGRGVFEGKLATVKFRNEEPVKLNIGLDNLNQLQKFVKVLVDKAGGKNE